MWVVDYIIMIFQFLLLILLIKKYSPEGIIGQYYTYLSIIIIVLYIACMLLEEHPYYKALYNDRTKSVTNVTNFPLLRKILRL